MASAVALYALAQPWQECCMLSLNACSLLTCSPWLACCRPCYSPLLLATGERALAVRCLPCRNCPTASTHACRLPGPCCLSPWLLNSLDATPPFGSFAMLQILCCSSCSIIRETVGPYLLKVVLIPLVYLSTTLVSQQSITHSCMACLWTLTSQSNHKAWWTLRLQQTL